MEHRAGTTPLHRTRLWLVLSSSATVVPAAFILSSVLRRQVCFGRPTLSFPCGFHSRACLVVFYTGFRTVWPIQPHLRFSLETTSGHLVLRVFLRLLLVKVCNLCWRMEATRLKKIWTLYLDTKNIKEKKHRKTS